MSSYESLLNYISMAGNVYLIHIYLYIYVFWRGLIIGYMYMPVVQSFCKLFTTTVLQFTDYDYSFGIFKLFFQLQCTCIINCVNYTLPYTCASTSTSMVLTWKTCEAFFSRNFDDTLTKWHQQAYWYQWLPQHLDPKLINF